MPEAFAARAEPAAASATLVPKAVPRPVSGGGEVEHLFVATGRQRQGTGTRLLQLAQARGEPLELWVFRRNRAAQAFYERHGFQPVRETDGAGNEEREPDVRYRWEPPGRHA